MVGNAYRGMSFLWVIFASCRCRVCEQPASMEPHEWPDDITKWPVSIAGGTGPVLASGISTPLFRATALLLEAVSAAASCSLSQPPGQGGSCFVKPRLEALQLQRFPPYQLKSCQGNRMMENDLVSELSWLLGREGRRC